MLPNPRDDAVVSGAPTPCCRTETDEPGAEQAESRRLRHRGGIGLEPELDGERAAPLGMARKAAGQLSGLILVARVDGAGEVELDEDIEETAEADKIGQIARTVDGACRWKAFR